MKSGRNHSYPTAKLFLTVLAQTPAIPLQCLRSVLALHEIPQSSHTVSLLLPHGKPPVSQALPHGKCCITTLWYQHLIYPNQDKSSADNLFLLVAVTQQRLKGFLG